MKSIKAIHTIQTVSALLILFSILVGCTPAATSTTVSATGTVVSPTNTVLVPTSTAVPPAAAISPTASPIPETPRILWDKTYHRTAGDMGEDVLVAQDGGFYIVGTANLDLSGASKTGDIYLFRTNANGEVLWEKTYGGDKAEEGLSIARTSDGNLLLAGMTKSTGAGGADAYLVKVDNAGSEIWSKAYGSPLDEMVSARSLADGGFMLWGNVVDPDDRVADPGAAGYGGYAGRSNIYLARLDAEGGLLWSHTYGDQNNLLASGGVPAPDGGFVVAASLLRYPQPGDDAYLLKVDADGEMVWERTWEEGTVSAYDLIRTADDQYLVAASYAPDNDTAHAMADFLLIKVDQQGNEVWSSTFGDPQMLDYPMVITQSSDGSYIAAGDWVKDFSGRSPAAISITKIDANGQLAWEKTIQPAGSHNVLRGWLPLADDHYLLVGSRMSRQFEIYLMKVDVGTGNSAYLGQTPPGLTPQVFAPGVVSMEGAMDFAITFSPDGQELYFTRRLEGGKNQLYEAHQLEGAWTAPAPVPFATEYPTFEPHISAGNQTLYFGWIIDPEKGEIWAVDRAADGWSAPRRVGDGMFVSSDHNGQFYVTNLSTRSLVQVSLVDGQFANLHTIGPGIHPAIAPDGSYLINDNGDGNLAVRFLQPDGEWSAPQSLTLQGIPAAASIASVSPDGRYLFYTYQNDLYWVSTELVTKLQK